ncbi:MAG: chloride channel protein [Elusimicrobiota bacterium]|jgi:H+/Cl- antiporter ClcA|nr:chloride channel protein [Elusimicrobiota bacterium]
MSKIKSELLILRRKIAFFNILKWFLASVFIGVIVGVFNGLFLKLLAATIGFTNSFSYYFVFLPIGLYLVNILATKVAPNDLGFSTNDAIASINERKSISVVSSIKAFFLPVLTIGMGGSAGKESPCADVGAGVASFFSKVFSFNINERRKLMICGVSAGFAGVFGVPISGALFGLEVLSVGTVFYEVMFPAFISGITSFQITQLMGVQYIYHPMTLGELTINSSLLTVLLGGLFFGLVSLLFMELISLAKIVFRFIQFRFSMFWKCFLAGSLVVLVALLTSPIYLGLSMDRVDAILAGDKGATLGFLFKMITTALTFAGGGVGGLITPVMFIGANAGYFFANIVGLDTATFAALGLVSVLAGMANTPLAASVMAIELFGATIAPYAAVSCIVSFLITGRRSLYDKQPFAFDKSFSDDDEDAEQKQYNVKELKRTLNEKNFILALFRHLIPDPKLAKNLVLKVEAQSDLEKKKKAKAVLKGEQKHNSLFSHLGFGMGEKEQAATSKIFNATSAYKATSADFTSKPQPSKTQSSKSTVNTPSLFDNVEELNKPVDTTADTTQDTTKQSK